MGRAWGMGPRGHDSTEMKPGSCECVTAKWIVVCGEQPYVNMQAAATSLPQAVAQGVRPTLADPSEEWQDKTTLPMVRLIEGCWHAEYAQRPTFGSGSAPMSPFSRPKSSQVKSSPVGIAPEKG